MAPFEELYGTRFWSLVGWFEVGEFFLLGPEVVYEANKKVWLIRDLLKMAYSRQKSYADNRLRDLEFDIEDFVYLKISPMKGVVRFCKKTNLSRWYLCPYEILKQVTKVAYELKLPIELALVHVVFHASILKRCIGDPLCILPLQSLGVNENLSREEVPVEILYCQVNKLRNKEVASVKVPTEKPSSWGCNMGGKGDMKSLYPHLLPLTPTQSWG